MLALVYQLFSSCRHTPNLYTKLKRKTVIDSNFYSLSERAIKHEAST